MLANSWTIFKRQDIIHFIFSTVIMWARCGWSFIFSEKRADIPDNISLNIHNGKLNWALNQRVKELLLFFWLQLEHQMVHISALVIRGVQKTILKDFHFVLVKQYIGVTEQLIEEVRPLGQNTRLEQVLIVVALNEWRYSDVQQEYVKELLHYDFKQFLFWFFLVFQIFLLVEAAFIFLFFSKV